MGGVCAITPLERAKLHGREQVARNAVLVAAIEQTEAKDIPRVAWAVSNLGQASQALLARVAKLEGALMPFKNYCDTHGKAAWRFPDERIAIVCTVGYLRKASEAMEG